MLFVLVLALLALGGDQAFNSIVGLLNGAVGLTYVLSIGCVLWRRTLGEPLPPARWSLGKLGIPLNIIALLYQSFATIISFFPLFAEVTAANFNWYVFTQDVRQCISNKFYLQGNCHVRVCDRHRSLKLLHHWKEDLCGACRGYHQRRIEGRELSNLIVTAESNQTFAEINKKLHVYNKGTLDRRSNDDTPQSHA